MAFVLNTTLGCLGAEQQDGRRLRVGVSFSPTTSQFDMCAALVCTWLRNAGHDAVQLLDAAEPRDVDVVVRFPFTLGPLPPRDLAVVYVNTEQPPSRLFETVVLPELRVVMATARQVTVWCMDDSDAKEVLARCDGGLARCVGGLARCDGGLALTQVHVLPVLWGTFQYGRPDACLLLPSIPNRVVTWGCLNDRRVRLNAQLQLALGDRMRVLRTHTIQEAHDELAAAQVVVAPHFYVGRGVHVSMHRLAHLLTFATLQYVVVEDSPDSTVIAAVLQQCFRGTVVCAPYDRLVDTAVALAALPVVVPRAGYEAERAMLARLQTWGSPGTPASWLDLLQVQVSAA